MNAMVEITRPRGPTRGRRWGWSVRRVKIRGWRGRECLFSSISVWVDMFDVNLLRLRYLRMPMCH